MEQNESQENVQEVVSKPEEELSWDDVQEELKASVKQNEQKKEDEELSWGDVQEELKSVPEDDAFKQEVSGANFDEFQKGEVKKDASLGLDFILDIPLTVSVELGRGRMLINELLQLGQGSVVELTKLAGEPMDLFVNNRLIARGEVVVVNEKFGVRLTDVVSATERVNKLR